MHICELIVFNQVNNIGKVFPKPQIAETSSR